MGEPTPDSRAGGVPEDGRIRSLDPREPGAVAASTTPAESHQRPAAFVYAIRGVSFAVALFLFVLAIEMMKQGSSSLAPRLDGTFPLDNAVSTLGLGALLAYLFLSGKPVAAFALTLFASGALTRLQAFTMLSGGRLGAAFIVLLVGFMYSVRGRSRGRSVGIGVLALSLTAVTYVPGMMVGYGILKLGWLQGIRLTSEHFQGAVSLIFGPVVDVIRSVVPRPLLLPLGGGLMIVAIKLLDRVLPDVEETRHEDEPHRLRRPWAMFALGFGVTLITFSVSVALTILVPLSAKGYITRKEALPYIMGSNVATLADTLLVALVVGNPVGVQIVLAEAIGVALVTVLLLLLAYQPLSRSILALDDWVVGSRQRLWGFVAVLVILPVLLMTSGFLVGPITS